MHVSIDREACSHDEVVGANGAVTQKRIVSSDGRKMTRVKIVVLLKLRCMTFTNVDTGDVFAAISLMMSGNTTRSQKQTRL